jgi:radical SAM superfamily enzyme YgiQ (UPF0313 family)
MQRRGAWTAVWPPLSLALVAAALEKEGFETKLDDCIVEGVSFTDLEKRFNQFKPELVVINTATSSITSDLKVARAAKKLDKRCQTVAFGIHVTALPEDSLQIEKELDCVVRGEPEMAVKELALAIDRKKSMKRVKGISYRQGKQIIHNPERSPLENLDELPFPAWQHLRKENYLMPFKNRPFFLIATGRGCPHGCRFCADRTFYGKRLRLRSPKKIADELEWAGEQFGVKDFLFWSESFTINSQFASQVAEEIIRRRLDIQWVCNSRVDNVDLPLLEKFVQAGCWMIGYGIESGNQSILETMSKRTTLDQARKAVADAHKAGLEVTGHCVIGYPGETEVTVRETVKFAKDLDLDFAQFYCAVPFPGSDLFSSKTQDYRLTTEDWFFFEQNFSVIDTPQLKAKKVMDLRRRAYQSFYLRPKIIWQTLKRIHSLSDLRRLLGMIGDFITWV